MKKIRIGVSTRIIHSENYIDDRDALSQDWASLLEKINILPILIPNSLVEIEEFLDEIELDGIILSGGDNIGEFPLRDKNENKIMEYAINKKIPIFGTFFGMSFTSFSLAPFCILLAICDSSIFSLLKKFLIYSPSKQLEI